MSQALSCGFGFASANIGGGGSAVSGAGTPPKMPVWTGANTLGDSQQSDNGTTVFIGTSATSTSAMFEVKSTTQGALFPRMTTIERDLIPVGATEDGLFIYNTSAQKFQYYDFIALAWITVESSIIGGETWSQTLTNGAISGGVDPQMSNGDVIKAVNGGGQLNLRSGGDSIYDLTNDNGGFTQAWVYGDTLSAQMGFSTVSFIASPTIAQITTNYNNNTDLARLSLLSNSMFFQVVDQSTGRIGNIGMSNNTIGNITTANTSNIPAYVVSQNATVNLDVVNSVANGGLNVIVKTSNANYSNQLIFNAGLAGEMALVHTP
ncbi:MAG: hypothetical protein HRT57_16000, partial [Crocinitomicaceae bacterium]|nr:hypothetical protein [Crocinitomicaceae bacterium]